MRNQAELAPDERREIAKRIRGLRQTQGQTLKWVSDATGISLSHLSEVERGQSSVSGEKLAKLAEVLGATSDYLLTGRGAAEGHIPEGLAQAAEELHLSFAQTRRLLEGKNSLVAKRSSSVEAEWDKNRWVLFYEKVRDIL